MNYFKTKLLIVIVYVFITLHDTYGVKKRKADVKELLNTRGVPRPNNGPSGQRQVEVKKTENEKPDVVKTAENCVETLEYLGRDRGQNYLEHYLDIRYELNNEENFVNYDYRIGSYVRKCIKDPYSIKLSNSSSGENKDLMESDSLFKNNIPGHKNEDEEPFKPFYGNNQDNDHNDQTILLFGSSPDTPSKATYMEVDHPDKRENQEKEKEREKELEQFDPVLNDKKKTNTQGSLVPNAPKTDKSLEILFVCDILLTIYDLFPLLNAKQYCEVKENNPLFDKERGLYDCEVDLKKESFIFEHGLDNYAYLQEKITNGELRIDEEENREGEDPTLNRYRKVKMVADHDKKLTIIQSNYIEYLLNEVLKIRINNYNLGSTAYWCKCRECEDDLRDAGFRERMNGRDNYDILQTIHNDNCDAMESKTRKEYCDYLKQSYYGEDYTTLMIGTFYWCANRIRETKENQFNDY